MSDILDVVLGEAKVLLFGMGAIVNQLVSRETVSGLSLLALLIHCGLVLLIMYFVASFDSEEMFIYFLLLEIVLVIVGALFAKVF